MVHGVLLHPWWPSAGETDFAGAWGLAAPVVAERGRDGFCWCMGSWCTSLVVWGEAPQFALIVLVYGVLARNALWHPRVGRLVGRNFWCMGFCLPVRGAEAR
jgi:hypothetical protein